MHTDSLVRKVKQAHKSIIFSQSSWIRNALYKAQGVQYLTTSDLRNKLATAMFILYGK